MTCADRKSGILSRNLLAALICLFLPLPASSSPKLPLVDLAELAADHSVSPPMLIATGISPDITPAELIASPDDFAFLPRSEATPHFSGIKGDVWLRFQVTNTGADAHSAKFVLRFPYLKRVDLYELRADGNVQHSTAGAAIAVTGKAVPAAYPVFSLDLPPGITREYFARIQNSSLIILPAKITAEPRFARETTLESVAWSLLLGAVIAFAVYAASMSMRDSQNAFRLYLCFALSTALYILVSSGLLNALIGTHLDFNFTQIMFFAQAMVIAFGTMFTMTFLAMEKHAPRLFGIFYALTFIGIVSGLGFLLPAWLARYAFFITTGAGPLIIAAGLTSMAASGITGARSLLIAWAPCLIASILLYMRILDITPYIPINGFLLPLALAITLGYLSTVLGGRVRQTEFWANTDTVTGLGNRRLIDQLRDLESHHPGERYGAAVAIDLDQFKPINDTFGQEAGDNVLISVAEKLRTHFSGRGDIFRIGGDEFLVLGYHWHSRMEIITQANAFLQANMTPLRHDGNSLLVGASIGIAFYDHGAGFASMLQQADALLAEVKTDGGGAIRIADQRTRTRRPAQPILFADNNDSSVHLDRLFGPTHARKITGQN